MVARDRRGLHLAREFFPANFGLKLFRVSAKNAPEGKTILIVLTGFKLPSYRFP
jgi:hypothetical protein